MLILTDIFWKVFVAIMADKMKEQQRQQREQAQKAAARAQATREKPESSTAEPRRSTRAHVPGNDTKGNGVAGKLGSVHANGRERVHPKKDVKAPKRDGGITRYFAKGKTTVQEDGPTVKEALADAADAYDAKPENLGAQELVATEQPRLVSGGKMREYQLEGLEWLKTLWMNGLCGILADEMGLGKTIQAISMIAFFKEKSISGPFLVAAPLSTVNNWVDEFARWTPDIHTLLYHGSKDERAQIRQDHLKMEDQKAVNFPVVVTSYEICMNDRKFLANYQWRYIIVDEGHRLKNMNCRLIKELLSYHSANRLLITGTPLQNNIAELWSLLHFLLPEVFNDLGSFESWFDFSTIIDDKSADGKGEKRKANLVSTMHAILKPFLLRRVKTDVETSLPKKREYILYAPLTTEQKDLYREILSGTSREYLEGKAVERIEAKSRTASLKRKANDSGRSTPTKSVKTSGASTPASIASTTGSRRGRKGPLSYKDITDREFNSKLHRLERGDESPGDNTEDSSPSLSSGEEIEVARAANLKLAKKEISSKKLQNPVMQARLACNSPHNFYWPWQASSSGDDEDPYSVLEVDETLISASGKMLLLDRLLPRLFQLGHKILIFSQFKTTLDILETYATVLRNYPCCRIDGSVSQTSRAAQIRSFNADPTTKLFLLSTRAGGQGINLVAADTVILFDSDWNPQQDLQAMDRAHRIGQTRPVIVYRLATRATVEETLLTKADAKRRLEKLVIQKGKFKSLLTATADGGAAEAGDAGSRANMSAKQKAAAETEELRRVLANDDFERYDADAQQTQPDKQYQRNWGQEQVLTEEDLAVLTDRSDAAYDRARKGLGGDDYDDDDGGGGANGINGGVYRVAETKADGMDQALG
jgi:ATP-dependent DNA helicase